MLAIAERSLMGPYTMVWEIVVIGPMETDTLVMGMKDQFFLLIAPISIGLEKVVMILLIAMVELWRIGDVKPLDI